MLKYNFKAYLSEIMVMGFILLLVASFIWMFYEDYFCVDDYCYHFRTIYISLIVIYLIYTVLLGSVGILHSEETKKLKRFVDLTSLYYGKLDKNGTLNSTSSRLYDLERTFPDGLNSEDLMMQKAINDIFSDEHKKEYIKLFKYVFDGKGDNLSRIYKVNINFSRMLLRFDIPKEYKKIAKKTQSKYLEAQKEKMMNKDYSEKTKGFVTNFGYCPSCTKKISLIATRCPYCTTSL